MDTIPTNGKSWTILMMLYKEIYLSPNYVHVNHNREHDLCMVWPWSGTRSNRWVTTIAY